MRVIIMTKKMEYRALDSKVLAVAVEGYVSDWSAYIGAVRGDNHDKEYLDVAEHGNKLPEKIARAIFPYEPWKSLVWRD